jgi:replicative DNA helicase
VLAIASQSRKAGNYGGDDAQENETGSARLDSLKESGDLEYSADAVAFLTPPISDPSRSARVVEPNRAVDLTVAKNRHGETGRVELVFRQAEGTIRPEAEHDDTPQNGSMAGESAVF